MICKLEGPSVRHDERPQRIYHGRRKIPNERDHEGVHENKGGEHKQRYQSNDERINKHQEQ